jgi:predicted DNA-binding transcriptional regulator
MPPIEFTFFSVTLFLALVALLLWKRRRMLARERVSKGLKGYVASTPVAPEHTDIEAQDDESLVIAQ